jgi:TolA-binding protein
LTLRHGAGVLAVALALALLSGLGHAAPKPVEDAGKKARQNGISPTATQIPPQDSYMRGLLGNLSINAPSDTAGSDEYEQAGRLFQTGLFDSAASSYQIFAMRHPRNLLVNDAIEHVLLIRENREPGDEALKLYAHTMALRGAGLTDSTEAAAKTGLERFPNARIRYHWQYLLAEIARERGHHDEAIRFALLVADSTSKSRLAPYALRIAGDETVAMGGDPAKALRYYQAILERYPASPLAPPVRVQVMEIRKKLQL